MTATSVILDRLQGGQYAEGFAFELLDAYHNVIGVLDADEGASPVVRNDTSRSIFRTCTNFVLNARTLANIDVLNDRVRPVMCFPNGDRLPLGVFVFGDDNRAPYSWGQRWTPELFDETFIVDQALDRTVGLAPGDSILSLINVLVGELHLPAVDLSDVADAFCSAAISFPVGSSRNQALVALFALLGCYPPFFDNAGVYTAKAAASGTAGPDHRYNSGERIIDGSIVLTRSQYRSPNRYEVFDSNPNGGFIGMYDLPDNAPNSAHNRGGFVIVKVIPMSGLPSVAVANLAAYVAALTDRDAYFQATFDSTHDPRHGTFDLVELLGDLYQETAWEITCVPGGRMKHTLAGIFGRTAGLGTIDVGGGGAEGGSSDPGTGGSGGGTGGGGGGDSAPVFVAHTPPGGATGDVVDYFVTATASPAATFSFTGTLPDGIALETTGEYHGTFGVPGTYSFTIIASNGVAPDATTDVIVVVIGAGGGGGGISSLLSVNDAGTTDSITWAAFMATTGVVKGRPFTSGGEDSEPATGLELQGYKNAHSFLIAAGDFGVPAGGALAMIATRNAMTSQPDGAARAYRSGYVQTGGDAPDATPVAFEFGPGVRMEFDYFCGMYTGDAFGAPGACVFPSNADGAGLWPAIWTLAKFLGSYGWPPELDIMEQFGHVDRMAGNTHLGNSFNDGNDIDNFSFPSLGHVTLDSRAGITCAIEWTSSSVQWFAGPLGGSLVSLGSYTGTRVPQIPMYLNFNLAIGNAGIGGPPNISDFPAGDNAGGAALLISRIRVTAI